MKINMYVSFEQVSFYSSVLLVLCVDGYAFMGSLIIQEVVKDLLNKGLDNAKVLLLAGSRYVNKWKIGFLSGVLFGNLY